MTPLTELGLARYRDFAGGLYPDGENTPPAPYAEIGVTLGATVQPVDRDGHPSTYGKVVMLCIGASNASHEFSRFVRLAEADPHKNPSLLMIDTARDRCDATALADSGHRYWTHVERQLQQGEAFAPQVQVVWLKTALAFCKLGFPANAQLLQRTMRSVLEILGTKYPRLKLIYVSSRTYGGYSESDLSREPTAYETGFAVKWLIEERINRPSSNRPLPWVAWGPYLWADGLTPRIDALFWERSDFDADGVHPSAQGAMKVAKRLLAFFKNDPSAQPWFLSQPR